MFRRSESIFYMTLFIFAFFVLTKGNDVKEEGRRAHSDRGGLWFGPRLGKRSLLTSNEDDGDVYYRLIEAADELKYYYDQLPNAYLERRNEPGTRVTKKVIFTPKLGRSLGDDQGRQYVDFTPRLGRRIAEDLAVTPSDQEIYRPDSQINGRTRYFSPRLGRTMSFSPRLGRELAYDNYPEKVRVARSANNTKSSR